MTLATIIGLGFVAALAIIEAAILWRYPDFRCALIAYWRPAALAARMDAWAARMRRP